VLVETLEKLLRELSVPVIATGGVRSAADVHAIDRIAPRAPVAIGSALAELESEEIAGYFAALSRDLVAGTDDAAAMLGAKKALQYRPYVVKSKRMLGDDLAIVGFRERLEALPGQFVFVKTARDEAKPYSVASNEEGGLEILVRAVGPASRALSEVQPGSVLRLRGPYGKPFALPPDAEVVFVGAGCGIAPILRAAQGHPGPRRFALGTRSVEATAFLERLHELGPVVHATEDGSSGLSGVALDALGTLLERYPPREDVVFYNCGPEIVLSQVDEAERRLAPPSRIFHVVERITACGIGICGKCATPEGLRLCVDGPVFSGEQFSPLRYSRDKTGRVVELGGGPKACPPS
jgi:dihydroorotate dehydrogenase (NAD+) catalytic subunit